MAGTSVPSMNALDRPIKTDQLYVARGTTDFKTTIGQILPGIYYPTALTDVGIQAAIDAASADGGGTVWLGNATYTITNTIKLDPTLVSLKGEKAAFDMSQGADTLIGLWVSSDNVNGTHYGHATQEVAGIWFSGKGKTSNQVGIQFYTPTNGADRSSRITVRDCTFAGFKYGALWKQNSYLTKFYSCEMRDSVNCLRVLNESNRGENLSFYGCTIGAADRIFWFEGSNVDAMFYSCSFDYSTKYGFLDGGYCTFVGCYVEGNALASAYAWELDNGAHMIWIGGRITLGATVTSAMFQIWGQGGQVSVFGTQMPGPTQDFISNPPVGFGVDSPTSRGYITSNPDSLFIWGGRDTPAFGKVPVITAAGTTQTDATQLKYTRHAKIGTVASGTGIKLPQTNTSGMEMVIWNDGANTLNIYPYTGGAINGGSTNAAITLASGKAVMVVSPSANVWKAMPFA